MATRISIKCQPIKKALDSFTFELKRLQNELNGKGDPTRPKSEIIQDILTTKSAIRATQAKLDECIRKNPPEPLPPTPVKGAPKHILEIETNHKNPKFDTSDPDWAAKFAGGGTEPFGTFPLGSGPEWKQVLAPDEDYDFDIVGASGWVLNPHITNEDFPFSHPFGFDWEFEFALDKQYDALIAKGNKEGNKAGLVIDLANDLHIPHSPNGLLGVEMESRLIPDSFINSIGDRTNGDRAVVFGRWIVDCGHDQFRTEIHPPLLMAVARSMDKDASGLIGSRAIFTSRPYLVSQKFTTDTDTITSVYNDRAEDDGFFLEHMLKEIGKILALNPFDLKFTLEAHPKIKSKPFQGIHLARFIVRPTSLRPKFSPLVVNPFKLAVSYNFTIRTGCAVQVVQFAEDAVEVIVSLNSAAYKAPPLPNGRNRKFGASEIAEISKIGGIAYLLTPKLLEEIAPDFISLLATPIALANFAQAVARGIETDEYDAPLQVNIDHKKNQVKNVLANQIVQGAGITVDDKQPYPLYGWLEAKWVETTPVTSKK